jgi:YfiR/HmsC-like
MYYYRGMKNVAFWILVLSLVAAPGFGQNYKLKTVVVYSFTRYILWPEALNTGDFEIKIFGESPFEQELKVMAQSKKVGNRDIIVSKITDLNEIRRCHILILPASQSARLGEILKILDGLPVLVVTEKPGLGVQGSDINFVDRDGRLAFELNQAAINRRKLKVSTELTRLAILI